MSIDRLSNLKAQLMDTINGKWPVIIENDPHLNWKPKQTWFRPDGWGYKDTKFIITKNDCVTLTGNKYTFANKNLPYFVDYCTNVGHANFKAAIKSSQILHTPTPPIVNDDFITEIKSKVSRISFENAERLMHSYGHTLQEMYMLKFGKFGRYCDVVLYPKNNEETEEIVKWANKFNVVLIPYGGGTNVTESLLLLESEKRMIASVDLNRMCKIISINKESMTARIEAGILGSQIDAELAKYGMCLGHEPDSVEFSSLGGWISTRASGMKKNAYGNIEDLLINVKIVTSKGTFEKAGNWERVSNGPDITQIVLGSEGFLGLITEAVLRVRPIPEKKIYDSYIFKDFATGIKFIEQLTRKRIFPASVRLMDNNQIKFALGFREEETSTQQIMAKFKKFYLSTIKGFDEHKLSMTTLLYEGSKAEVEYQMNAVNSIASTFAGIRSGAEIGIRGYLLTFVIAYMRDLAMEHNYVAESFETTVPWEKIMDVCRESTLQIEKSCKEHGIKSLPFVTFRISQIYQTGVTVYCYFGFSTEGISDPVAHYSDIENDARDAVMRNGGSLSHHHGIGKLRKPFVPKIMPEMAQNLLKAIKKEWDPNNIFANGNIITP